jgi:hypothetical protein
MTTTTPSPTLIECDAGESQQVFCWRLDVLERAGYPTDAAGLLATCTHVDLHVATDLRHRGCPPETALRILL